MNNWVVVDTNVLLVAEGQSNYTLKCKVSCGNVLREIQLHQIVVLDSGREILSTLPCSGSTKNQLTPCMSFGYSRAI